MPAFKHTLVLEVISMRSESGSNTDCKMKHRHHMPLIPWREWCISKTDQPHILGSLFLLQVSASQIDVR